jgi:hypothetical protein
VPEHHGNSIEEGVPASTQRRRVQGQGQPVGAAGRRLPCVQLKAVEGGEHRVRLIGAPRNARGQLLDFMTA